MSQEYSANSEDWWASGHQIVNKFNLSSVKIDRSLIEILHSLLKRNVLGLSWRWSAALSGVVAIGRWMKILRIIQALCFSHFHQLAASLRKMPHNEHDQTGFAFWPHQSTLTSTNTQTVFWSVLHKACHYDNDFDVSQEAALQTENADRTGKKGGKNKIK